jgi:hypothetical protein
LGLLVPVAIHLWNRRPGREVAVGSLRWLTAGANRRLRNLKLEQFWLLLLRAALLAVLALALAGPVWQQALPAGRGQVLLSPEVLGKPAFATLRPTIDSLRRRGYALRWLAAGFPKMSGAAWRTDSLGRRDSARVLASGGLAPDRFLWARVQQAAAAFAGQPLYVVTPAALRGFEGLHPALPANITWQTLPNPATATWVQAAGVRGDSLRLLVGKSTENQTTFQPKSILKPKTNAPFRVGGLGFLRLEPSGAGQQVVLPTADKAAANSTPPVPVRSQPLRMVMYATPAYALDARYLQAGVRAAAAGLLVPVQLSMSAAPPSPGTRPDWLFWLSDAPLPAGWQDAVQRGTRVWQQATATGMATNTRLATPAADEAPAVILQRSTAAEAPGSTVLWADGLGRAVLSQRSVGQGAFYQLHTRLHPAWSDLADNPGLPARLLEIIQPENAGSPASATSTQEAFANQDLRAMDAAQLPVPVPTAGGRTSPAQAAPKVFRVTDLRPWLVLAVGVLSLLERLLARRREALPTTPVS